MPLKVRFLTKCHTEKRRVRRIIKTKRWKSQRHRRCIERRSLSAHFFSNFIPKVFPKSYQESVRYTSVALCAVGTSVTLRYLRPSVTPCAYYIRRLVYHSIFQKNLFLSHLCFEFSLHNNDENTPKNTQKQPF